MRELFQTDGAGGSWCSSALGTVAVVVGVVRSYHVLRSNESCKMVSRRHCEMNDRGLFGYLVRSHRVVGDGLWPEWLC